MKNLIEFEQGKLEGRVKLVVKAADGSIVRETVEFKNLITDFGLSSTAQNDTAAFISRIQFCAVGASSITPQFTDVALGSQIGSRTFTFVQDLNVNTGSPDYIHRYVRTYQFAQGAIVGNVAEVGLFGSASGDTAATRALIKDGLGNPTSITVLSTETLFVTYEIRFVPNQSSVNSVVTISGSNYSVSTVARGYQNNVSPITIALTSGASSGAYETQTVPALGANPVGTIASSTSITTAAHVPGAFYRDRTAGWGPTVANFGTGIGTVTIGYGSGAGQYHFNITFNDKVMKTNLQTFTFTVRFTLGRV